METQTTGRLRLRLGPVSSDDLERFVGPQAMHSYRVLRYLGRSGAPIIEDEQEWLEGLRKSKDNVAWGLFVEEDSAWRLVGNTSLNSLANNTMFRRATSGVLIFDQEYWGRGIASAAHIARTYFAFREQGLGVIYSGVYHPNVASRKAIESVGYVHTGTNRCEGQHEGKWLHMLHFECVNPDDWAWNAWWSGEEEIPQEFLDARTRTASILRRAERSVSFP